MTTSRIRRWFFTAVSVVSLLAAACSNNNGNEGNGQGGTKSGATSGASIGVTEKDFAIGMDTTALQAGNVTFRIANAGPSVHEFVVLKTDLPEDGLPMMKDKNGIPIVDE